MERADCMKVLTVTTYNVYNYGAALQAYALQQYLLSQGHESLLLNYQPEYLTRKYDYRWVNPESKMSRFAATRFVYRILKFLQRQTTLKRKRAFDDFVARELRQTELYVSSRQVMDEPPAADVFVAGSDQIWNTFYDAGRDPVFYLAFARPEQKVAYAASFSFVEIAQDIKEQLARWLSDFKAIGVREFHGLDILHQLNLEGQWVLDPVFLLDVAQWKKMMLPFEKREPYLLIYDFEGNPELKAFAKRYAASKNLRIYSINDTYPRLYADRNFSNGGPRDFLTLIYNCDAFVSNSFHGTAFAIMFNKPVYVFERHRHKVNSRMESLTRLFGISDCILRSASDCEEALQRTWDFSEINEVMVHEASKSREFLKQALAEKE